MIQLPRGTLGSAVGVLIFTFICLFTSTLLIWLYWKTRERLHYVALLGYFSALCCVSSIIQQIYNYTLWTDLMWQKLYYVKANYRNADVIFNNGNFGFMRVLAIIRLFCYIMEASYLFAYSIQIAFVIHDTWSTKRHAEVMFFWAGRLVPIAFAVTTIGVLQSPLVQKNFTVYLLVANLQSSITSILSIILIIVVIRKYIASKFEWRNVGTSDDSGTWWSRFIWKGRSTGQDSTISAAYASQGVVFDASWLVIRLSIAILLVCAFVVATIVSHLPQIEDIERDAQADEPDLGAERALSNITGYIFGVTPGLAIFIVFGLASPFRKIMKETFVPERWRTKEDGTEHPSQIQLTDAQDVLRPDSLQRSSDDADLQLQDLAMNGRKRPLTDLTNRLPPTKRPREGLGKNVKFAPRAEKMPVI